MGISTTEPIMVPRDAVVAIQGELIGEHGGLHGPLRLNDLEAALARPRNLVTYADADRTLSLARLAAAYGFALARGHCFPDGNKRIALAVVDVFLQINGRELSASEPDAASTFLALAAGKLTEDELAAWTEARSAPL
jgi:death-on-curing protein